MNHSNSPEYSGEFFIGEKPAYNSARDCLCVGSERNAQLQIDQIELQPYLGPEEKKIES